MDEDGKGKHQKVKNKKKRIVEDSQIGLKTELNRKRKRTDEEVILKEFRPGMFHPFK